MMGHSLCNRCDQYFGCCLNFDGKPCRKLRSVEPTNYDRVMEMDVEQLANLLATFCPEFSAHYWTEWLNKETKEDLS